MLEIDSLWHGYGYPIDLLFKLSKKGIKVVEVPVRPIYSGMKSKRGILKYILPISFVMARIFIARLGDAVKSLMQRVLRYE